jgi:hypothetical protein
MNLNKQLLCFFFSIVTLLISSTLSAETQPKFTIIPSTPIKWLIPSNGQTTIIYTVTNQTKIKRTLVMKPIAGITQQTLGAGVCSSPFTLNPGQSCQLVLPIIGSQITGRHITQGPVICKTQGPGNNAPDLFLCSEACNGNQLDITGVGFENANLTITPSELALRINGTPGSLTITNHSQTVTALNVASQFAAPPGVPAGWVSFVTFTSSGCTSIAPGASCTITFTPKSIVTTLPTPESQLFIFQGNNTTQAPATVRWHLGLAEISVTPTFLSLITGGPGQLVTVTNNSTNVYALDINANLPASYTDVTQIPIGCAVVAPGGTCTILFIPGSTIHMPPPIEYTYIKGINTTKAQMQVVVENSGATIKITDPLSSILLPVIQLEEGGPSKSLTITNVSSTPISALNVGTSNIASTALNPYVQQTTDCPASLAQGQSCHLTFVSLNTGTIAPTIITIPDPVTNTNTVQAQISVTNTLLTISPDSLVLATQNTYSAGSRTRSITITNTGSVAAINVSYVTTLPPDAVITQSPGSCLSNIPATNGTCTLLITPGNTPSTPAGLNSNPVSPNTLTLSGPNIATLTIPVTILDYMNNWKNEGYVYSIDSFTPSNTSVNFNIVSDGIDSQSIDWVPPTCPALVSTFDPYTGQLNTLYMIASCPTPPYPANSYSAGYCYNVKTPIHNWYLPAMCELANNEAGGAPRQLCAIVPQNILLNALPLVQSFQHQGITNLWSSVGFDIVIGYGIEALQVTAPEGLSLITIPIGTSTPESLVCVETVVP